MRGPIRPCRLPSQREITASRPILITLIAAALAPLPLRASGNDALLLRASAGGERKSGAVASCDAERCFVDRAAVPLTDVVWIGLGVGEDAPPTGVAARGVVLADGSVRAGRFLGMSLGTVLLETEEFDRALVRWVRLAEAQSPVDVLVRRDGAVRTGALQGCAAGACTMAGEATARAELAWIGLAVDPEQIVAPSAPQDPGRDTLQFADGSTRVTPLIGVGGNDVVAGIGTFARADIAWIYLAPPVGDPGPPVVYQRSPPSGPPAGRPPEPPVRAPEPPVPPRQAPPPPGPGGSTAERGERGGLWTGTITGRHVAHSDDGTVHEWSCQATARLREWIVPMFAAGGRTRRIGRFIQLAPEGTVLYNRASCRGQYVRYCEGEGTINLNYGPEVPQASAIYLKDVDVDTTDLLGFDVPREGGRYWLGISIRDGDLATFPMTITNTLGQSETFGHGYGCWLQGNHHLLPDNMDPEKRSLQDGRMVGSYSTTWHAGALDVSWSLCREGGPCPPPPLLPPASGGDEPPTDCDETATDRALLDVQMDQMKALLRSLKIAREEHLGIERQAAQWQDDFNRAAWDCRYWNAAQMLASFLIGNYSPTVAGQPLGPAPGRPGTQWTGGYEPGKAFTNFLSMLDKVIENDSSWVLPDHEFDPLFGASVEDLWDGVTMGWAAIGPNTPQSLREGLRTCGAPTLNEVLDGAYHYLSLLEQIKPLADRLNTLINDVVDKDEDIFDFCLSHPKVCEDYERCRQAG